MRYKNLVMVTSLKITAKTIELVSDCLSRQLTSNDVKLAINKNEVTLALPFTGGYLIR